jgi:hypothetical protein
VEQALRGLPGAAEAPSSRPELLPAPPARFVRRQLRVLLADGNADMHGYVRRLPAAGARCEAGRAAGGQAALDVIEVAATAVFRTCR